MDDGLYQAQFMRLGEGVGVLLCIRYIMCALKGALRVKLQYSSSSTVSTPTLSSISFLVSVSGLSFVCFLYATSLLPYSSSATYCFLPPLTSVHPSTTS